MAIRDIQKGVSMDEINAWWDDVHKLYRQDRDAFDEYVTSNPEMGIRWHARAAHKNVNTGTDNKVHDAQARLLAQQIGYGGTDGKMDGKAIATDYNTFPDVQSEWGKGDFWKIGTPQTFGGGFNDFFEDNPLAIVGLAAAPFMPAIAAAVGGALGVSAPVATGIINAGLTAAGGGDFKDIITSGLTSYGIADAGNLAHKALQAVPDSAMAWVGDTFLPTIEATGTAMGGSLPEGAISLFGQGAQIGQEAFETFGSIPGGIGTIGAGAGLLDEFEQYNQDLQSGIPAIQDQTAGLPQSPTAGGAPAPAPPVVEEEDLLTLGGSAGGGGLLDIVTSGGGFGGGTQGLDEVAQAEEERNANLAALSHIVPEGSLSLGGSMVALPGTGSQPPSFPSGTVSPDEGLLTLGGSAGGGGGGFGGGTGTGVGTGTTGGQEPPPPEFDITELLKLIPLMPQEEEQEYNFDPLAGPDLSYGINKPDYGEVTQRDPLETPLRAIQAPMVTPAINSGQIGFDEWLQDYTARQDDPEQQDILSMIAGKRTDRGII